VLAQVIYSDIPRSQVICSSMAAGIRACGDEAQEIREEFYNGPTAHVAVFYGLRGNCRQAFNDYRNSGRRAVYIDLGYWGRTDGGKLSGYHKIAVNGRHPTAYFQKKQHKEDRFRRFGLSVKPWQKEGKYVLLAGMGAKAADFEGFATHEWELDAVAKIRQFTQRPIIYRPKPSWRNPEPIDGTFFSPRTQPLQDVLRVCHCVVSHHSNVCIDALLEGVPSFCVQGVAVPMSLQDIVRIEDPVYPNGREQWAADIAYTQWRPDEMRQGLAWQYLKGEGLV